MQNRRLLTIVTMMILAGGPSPAQQIVTIDELRIIERLIIQKDCLQLYNYLVTNPHTIQGSDPLAVELQTFVVDVRRGGLDCFSASTTQRAGTSTNDVDDNTRIY